MLFFFRSNTAPLTNQYSSIMITVFYDGQCGLCSKEINHYRKVAPEGVFDWRDLTESDDALKRQGISLAEGLKILHLVDHLGNVHKGIDAFIVIWQQMKGWRLLAVFVSLPIIKPLSSYAYKLFANWRFKRLSHCQLAEAHERPTKTN